MRLLADENIPIRAIELLQARRDMMFCISVSVNRELATQTS